MSAKVHSMKKEKIESALELLDEVAKDTKEDLTSLMKGKYHNLEKSIASIEPIVRKNLDEAAKQATETYEKTKQLATETAKTVDKNVHTSPWAYIGGAALAGSVLGFLLGRK